MAIPKPRVCFSYAAYAKNLIRHICSENIPVEAGLSESEFAAVESSLSFTFPPDLRSILQEGLPIGTGFPNWRSSSNQQLNILTSLPILGICKEVSRSGFWIKSWDARLDDIDRAVNSARGFLRKSPILVPIYRNFYIPSVPCMAGNPVFYVHGGDVSVWSFDIARFFQQLEYRETKGGGGVFSRRPTPSSIFPAPAWAATEARRIEFWTEMAKSAAADEDTRGWWSGDLGGCLAEVCGRLRDGGWGEEDVREMMMMDGCDEFNRQGRSCEESLDKECGGRRVRAMSARLLHAGWSREDVVESLGWAGDCHWNDVPDDGDLFFDIHFRTAFKEDEHNS